MSLRGEPIIVLGMFRGGTSCLSTALAAMGVHLGNEQDFQKANEFNEGGYWELEDMQQMHVRCFYTFGMTAVGNDRLPFNWRDLPGGVQMVEEIQAMLEKHFAGHDHWGWKEPGTADLLPLYKEALAKSGVASPRYAISVRNPLSVASSRKRQFDVKASRESGESQKQPPNEQRNVGLWVHYMLHTLKGTQGAPRHLLSYENLLQEPRKYLKRLADDLLPYEPTDEQMEAAYATIKPQWSHSKFSMNDLKTWPSIVARTYELCLRMAEDPEGLNAGKYDPETDELWDEWLAIGNMTHETRLPSGQMILSWQEAGQVQHVKQDFTPTGDWQVIRQQLQVGPGQTLQIYPYQMACQIWIKRAVWHVGGKQAPAGLMQGPTGIMEQPGMLRLTAFGPAPLLVKAPQEPGPYEFELEFLLQMDMSVMNTVAMMLAQRYEQARRTK